MARKRLGVGIVGLQPGRSWAAIAHVPALQALAGDYEIVAVANRTQQSADAAAEACGISRSFGSIADLVACEAVDIVAVTVKVPEHFPIVTAALEAGKHVYCEWPIGNGLDEARKLADLARDKGVIAAAGTQARAAAPFRYLRDLVADGFVGEVLSTTLVATGLNWGPAIEAVNAYTLERTNGANMLTIPFGHTMAALADVLGEVVELSATLATRRRMVQIVDTGEMAPMTSPDQVLVNGVLAGGAPISIHYRGGMPRGTGLLLEINGTQGDLQVTGFGGHAQFVPLTIKGARSDEAELRTLELPGTYRTTPAISDYADNVAEMYSLLATDLRNGTRRCPRFEDAVATHRLCAAIEEAARTGLRVKVESV